MAWRAQCQLKRELHSGDFMAAHIGRDTQSMRRAGWREGRCNHRTGCMRVQARSHTMHREASIELPYETSSGSLKEDLRTDVWQEW